MSKHRADVQRVISPRELGRGIRYLAKGDASFSDAVLTLDPAALLMHSGDSISYLAMKTFYTRGGGRPLSTTASGRLWARVWCKDREKLDAAMTEAGAGIGNEESAAFRTDVLVGACQDLYTDLYDFTGLSHLREVFNTFTTPTVLLRALDRVHCEPDLDLTLLDRLSHPGQKLRAVNMLSESIRLPEAVVAIEAAALSGKRVIDADVERWARSARMFLAMGVSADECVTLIRRVAGRHYHRPKEVYESRSIPDEYWEAITSDDSNISSNLD